MDFHHRMIRTCAGMIADRAMRECTRDVRRAARSLADLGGTLAGSEQSKQAFAALHKELERSTSPLYGLLCAALSQVDQPSLKALAVNLGGSELRWGSSVRRLHKNALGGPLPSLLCFQSCDAHTKDLIAEANKMGIYLFSIRNFSIQQASKIALTYSESTFLYSLSEMPAADLPAMLAPNLCFLVEMKEELPVKTLSLLKKSRRLFGLYTDSPLSKTDGRQAFENGCLFAAAPSDHLWSGPLLVISRENLQQFCGTASRFFMANIPDIYSGSLSDLLRNKATALQPMF